MEAKLIYDKYDEMMGLLKSCREKKYQQWVEGVDQDCHFNLGQPLIQRDPISSLIQVNFSKAVGPKWGGLVGVGLDGGESPGSPRRRLTPPPTVSIYGGCSVYRCACVFACVFLCMCMYVLECTCAQMCVRVCIHTHVRECA